MRGLDVVEVVAAGSVTLQQLSDGLALKRSTAHRLAASLLERGYLAFTPRSGYRLGPKLIELGHLAQEQADIIQVARPHLENLSNATSDTIHLGVLDRDMALFVDKLPGRRRISIASRIGDRQRLTSTGLGRALILDHPSEYWDERFATEQGDRPTCELATWRRRMMGYADAGCAFELDEDEDRLRCVAAPVRDARGHVVAAISVSGAAQYMSDERIGDLAPLVIASASAISRDLGCSEERR